MNKILFIIILLLSSFANSENRSLHPGLDPESNIPTFLRIQNNESQIKAISEYLKSLKAMSANFTQTDKHGNKKIGKFYLSRPSKMRWEYKSPKEVIIIMNSERVYYYDKDLDQFSHYIGEKGLIGLFGEDDIFASKYVDLLDLRSNGDNIEVTFQKKADSGKITLVFATNPFQILGFIIHEESASKIKIKFDSIINNALLDDSLFTFSHSLAPKSR